MPSALRFTDDATIEGILVPFNSQDSHGTTFSRSTEFYLQMFDKRPLLWHHGLGEAGAVPIGQITHLELRNEGVWMRAVLDKAGRWFNQVKDRIKRNLVGLSSGALDYLVRIDEATGHGLSWPICEGSVTPTPSNSNAIVTGHTLRTHFRAAHLPAPDLGLSARRPQSGSGSAGDALRQHSSYLQLLRREARELVRDGPQMLREAREQELASLQRCLDQYQQQEIRRRAARYRSMTPAQIRAELAHMRRTLERLGP